MNLKALALAGEDHRHWYTKAYAKIERVCGAHGWNVERFIAILAITSPRVPVSRNWALTLAYMADGSTNGMLPNVIAGLAHYEKGGEIRGRKTGAFARALLGDTRAIVLDVWISRALRVPQKEFTGPRYDSHAARIARLAKRLGWTPVETQAALWAGIMRAHNNTPREF